MATARTTTLLRPKMQHVGLWQKMMFSTLGFNKEVDYYRHLGLKSCATQDEIKLKFYELAKKHHPDSANSSPQDEERFKQITAAYDILSNTQLKRQYDAVRARYQAGPGGAAYPGYGDFDFNYQARESKTYKYSRESSGFRGRDQGGANAGSAGGDWQRS